MNEPALLRIERMNYVFGAIAALGAAFTQTQRVTLGIMLGVALTCLNFAAMRRIIFRATANAAQGNAANKMLLMLPKMMLLMAAVVLLLRFLPISAGGFAIGYSVFVLSIFIEAIYSTMIAPPKDPAGAATPEATHDDHAPTDGDARK